jgi:anti-sigma28 factor (negative regulator of flagellin synthesis)
MQAFRKPSPPATQPRAPFESGPLDGPSPQPTPSATSGTYFKAVRPTEAEAAAASRGEPGYDGAKIEGLRFELDMGIWRVDSDRVASRLLDDAGYLGDADDDE